MGVGVAPSSPSGAACAAADLPPALPGCPGCAADGPGHAAPAVVLPGPMLPAVDGCPALTARRDAGRCRAGMTGEKIFGKFEKRC